MVVNKLANALKTDRFSKLQLSVFVAVFALIGLIILIKSFAAPNPSLPGDLNNDSKVDIADLSLLLSDFGSTDPVKIAQADIDNNGKVDILDMSALLSHFGQSLTTKPSIPTGLTAAPGDSKVTLTWNANPASDGVDSYQVYWTTDSGWNAAPSQNLNVTGTSYTVTGLTNNTTYYFRISAHNTAGYGGWTAAVSAAPWLSELVEPFKNSKSRFL